MTTTVPVRPPSVAWLAALRQPQMVLNWSLAEWEFVVRLSRRLRLLARLAESLDAAGLLAQVPVPVLPHLLAAQRVSRFRIRASVWLMERVAVALADGEYPRVLLKGGAYIAQGLPIAAGRMPSDLDILIPQAHLQDAVDSLMRAGWTATSMDTHDTRYYREWSHEVAPMRHPLHEVELDVHHNILPPVARTHVDAALLLQHIQPSALKGWWVLDPVDQLLHSAAHLFHDSEPRDRIRDLVDMDGLIELQAAVPAFWPRLTSRAIELGLTESLALAFCFLPRVCGTVLPGEPVAAIMDRGLPLHRRLWLLPLLDGLLALPLAPDQREGLVSKCAAAIFLARFQLHRLPLKHLLPHLWHKLAARQLAGTAE